MQFTLTFKSGSSGQQFYAIGQSAVTLLAIRATFTNHGFKIHKEDHESLTHYPWGYFDAVSTKLTNSYLRVSASGAGGPVADEFRIQFKLTDNPNVTLLLVSSVQKLGWPVNKLARKRLEKFHSAFIHEMQSAKIAIVENEDWPALLKQKPSLSCWPRWQTKQETMDFAHSYFIEKFGKERGEAEFMEFLKDFRGDFE